MILPLRSSQISLPALANAVSLSVVACHDRKFLPLCLLACTDNHEAVLADPPNDALGRPRGTQGGGFGKGYATQGGLVAGVKGRRGERIDVGEDSRHIRESAQDAPFARVCLLGLTAVLRAASATRSLTGLRDVKNV